MTTLGACKISGSPEGRPKLSVKITDQCARHGKKVPYPAIDRDARRLLGHYRAALVNANKRIERRHNCEANVRSRYSRGG